MKVQTSHSSYHTTAGSHMLTLDFFCGAPVRGDFSGWTRARLRSGVRAAFDGASTMLHQPLNGDARRRSSVSSKLRPLRNPHSNDRRHSFDPIPLPFASALSDCRRTFSAARPAVPCVLPSRSGGPRSSTARTRGVLNEKRACRATTSFLVSVVPPSTACSVVSCARTLFRFRLCLGFVCLCLTSSRTPTRRCVL